MLQLSARSFLFLQTIASPFFLELGQQLDRTGYKVSKINFNGGDLFFWHGLNEINYVQDPKEFGHFLKNVLQQHDFTDIVLFGDCRPWHLHAIKEAHERKISIWVFEEGYLRPHWITLENNGVNANSSFDLRLLQKKDTSIPQINPQHKSIHGGFAQRVIYDFIYNFMNLFLKLKFPHHRTHRPYPIGKEYFSWAQRLGKLLWQRNLVQKQIEAFFDKGGPKYLFPLQLDSDYQVRVHSPFGRMTNALEFVIAEFAKHAQPSSHLLIKNHPLDNGLINFEKNIMRHSEHLGISDRVFYVDGGDLNQILSSVDGVVTINSTVGISALEIGCPVMLLGKAIYGIEGLVVGGEDTQFWRNPTPPNQDLFNEFRVALLNHCHVNGNFYTRKGIDLAVQNSFTRMTSPSSLILAND